MPFPSVVSRTVQKPGPDSSMFLEELDIPESLREVIRRGFPWYMIELGGGLRTVSAQMLDERTDAELLKIAGMSPARLRTLRKAIAQDPGVLSSLYPHISREEAREASRGAFPEQVEQTFGPDGRPVVPGPADGDGSPL
jgi:hypothetical protein